MEMFSTSKRLIFIACVSAMIFYMVDSSGHRQKFMEPCNKSKKCDFTRWFKCERGKCVCWDPDQILYDEVSRYCVGRAGANCSQTFYPFDDDPLYFHMRGPTTNHWRYGNSSLRCGQNAFCHFNGSEHRCKCDRHFYDTVNGTCLPLKLHGDNCSLNKECNPDKFLLCINNTCQCDKSIRSYNEELKKCVVPAGTECETMQNKDDGRHVDDCPQNSVCSDGLCRCTMGTQIHSDKTCKRGYGQECDIEHPCGDSALTCRSKLCQCKYFYHQVYDDDTKECVSLASGPCTINDTSVYSLHCTKNAECVQRGAIQECKCIEGFLQTTSGECAKVFGSSCEQDIECDRRPPLACVNSKCGCADMLQVYNPEMRKCLGVAGTRCNYNSEISDCIENASCKKYEEEMFGKMGHCICNTFYSVTANRTCARD